MTTDARMHVVVGVIYDPQGQVLITRRPRHVHLGGLWEFPGGKLETGETVVEALQRELREEVGIQVHAATPLIKIRHDYDDRRVLLDVWRVLHYTGIASACEGQAMCWLPPAQLDAYCFPAANGPIVKAVQLPDYYAILEGVSREQVMSRCQQILERGVRFMQFRVKALPQADVDEVFDAVIALCRQTNVTLLVNSDLPGQYAKANGLHWSSRALMASVAKPANQAWVAASCHNLKELQHAEKLGADFAVLAPVHATTTHPDAQPLGWNTVKTLLEQVNIPVFVMGGLDMADIETARLAGAQGIAGIRAFINPG
jgi:8-oxo-dGTP diphosphatase